MMWHETKMGFISILTCIFFFTSINQAKLPRTVIWDLPYKNMDFAMRLFRKISSYHDKNIFFSPLSVSKTFTALSLAANGDTYDELLKGLNLDQLKQANQPEFIPKMFQKLQENMTQNGTVKLEQDMAIFVHTDFEIEKKIGDQMMEFFHACIKSVNFSDTNQSITFINDYVKHRTKKKVMEIISSLDPQTQLMFVDTIFFQGSWEMPFDANFTDNAPFYIDNYNIVQVPMMFKEDKFYSMEDPLLGARVLKLPYLEGFSMLILLPNNGIDYTVIEDEISAAKFLSWIKKLKETKLEIKIPKFKLEQSYFLHDILPDMGFVNIFSSSANLTNLSNDSGLKVSEVLHKAAIEVDETGTIAAAVTAIGITPYSLPRTFIVNKPFFFFIYHEATNCLLFMGRVIDPTKN